MLVFLVECIAAFLPTGRRRFAADPKSRPRLAVLVPAHNEERQLAITLASIMPQLKSGDRALVVADNCDDTTADIARRCGAMVIERHNDKLRGKGYALAAGMAELRKDPPAVVVVIDADCRVEPGSLGRMAAAASESYAPVQAVYLLEPAEDAGVLNQLSAFAFLVKNLVRQRGLLVLGQPGLLQGTGMAFPWMIFETAHLDTGHIVEDLVIGLDMLERGHSVRFCDVARVTSPQVSRQSTLKQRTRWEHGYLSTMLTRSPRLALQAIRSGRTELMAMALDLAVPPLSLLMFLYTGVLGLAVGAGVLTGHWWAAGWLLSLGLVFLFTMMAVCRRFGRDVISVSALLLAPAYALWKLPIYLRFITQPEQDWVRADRSDPNTPPPASPSSNAPASV